MKILLAEADDALAGRLFHLLVKNGCQTTAVKTGQAAHADRRRALPQPELSIFHHS